MKKNNLLFCFLFIGYAAFAQTKTADSTHHKRFEKLKPFLTKFSIGLPDIHFEYCVPFKKTGNENLPYGMDKYFGVPKSETGFDFPFGNNFNFRIIAIYYKDKLGVEFYYGGFGGIVPMNDFAQYLEKKYPNHYISDDYSIMNKGKDYDFKGVQFGITYKIHLKSFIIEPKFKIGFETQYAYNYEPYVFKEIGTNNFTEYQIEERVTTRKPEHSYHAQLNVGKRITLFKRAKRPFTFEAGIKGEYIYAPYSLNVKVNEHTYGMPIVSNQFDITNAYKMYSF